MKTLNLEKFQDQKLEKLEMATLVGGDWTTKYRGSDGSSGNDTICDNDGDGTISVGDTIEFE